VFASEPAQFESILESFGFQLQVSKPCPYEQHMGSRSLFVQSRPAELAQAPVICYTILMKLYRFEATLLYFKKGHCGLLNVVPIVSSITSPSPALPSGVAFVLPRGVTYSVFWRHKCYS